MGVRRAAEAEGAPRRIEIDAGHIAAMPLEELEVVFKGPPALHRFPGSMAKRTQQVCQHLVEHHGGRAEDLWEDDADAKDLFKRLKRAAGLRQGEGRRSSWRSSPSGSASQPDGLGGGRRAVLRRGAPLHRRRQLARHAARGAGVEEGEEGGGQGQGPSEPRVGEPSIGERVERSVGAQIVIGILIVTALLAQLVTHLPESSAVEDELGPSANYAGPPRGDRVAVGRVRPEPAVHEPEDRGPGDLRGRQHGGVAPARGAPASAANLRYYRWRKWLERVRSDDFRNLWEPTCQWIASLYDEFDSPVEKVQLVRLFHENRLIGEQPPYEEFVYHTCTPGRRLVTAPTTRPGVALGRFFFRPQSTAPMTLVRIGWGATAAVWAISLLPDIDPFFVKGDLMYERTLSPGAWNVLPHLPGTTPAWSCAWCSWWRAWRPWSAGTPGSARWSRC